MALTKSMRLFTVITLATLGIALGGSPAQTPSSDNLLIRTADGPVQGSAAWNGTRAFLGIPYAAPPVGPLRWKPPQRPVERNAVFAATHFGHRCIQFADYPDMVFRDAGPSEDCLTLNIWAPAHTTGTAKLPVMVWIHGGGFVGGGSSEPRQDGAILAARGVVVVSMNYRLGMLGFFVHPALTAESPHHAAGNYGLMDQAAALAWVHANIGAFGGDPENITLFGESAGSFSVSALMASPLATDRIAKAIGESGAAFFNRTLPFAPLAEREMTDPALAKSILGTGDLAALRAMPAEMLAAKAALRSDKAFPPDIDGYVLTAPLPQIYAAGRQAHIPLLAGWNADELRSSITFSKSPVTTASFTAQAKKDFGQQAEQFLAVYPSSTDEEAILSAGDYASDRFLVYSTWRWIEAQAKTGDAPVYRYRFDLPAPADKFHPLGSGAFHSDDIEYVFGTLQARQGAVWRPEDRVLSDQIQRYWTNFARTGNPNGPGLPQWPAYDAADKWQVMQLDRTSAASADDLRARYLFLDSVWGR